MRKLIYSLLKLFHRPQQFVEVRGPSNQMKVMTHDQYISNIIAESRTWADLASLGFTNKESRPLPDHIMRRWMI